ncbi:hypothetical protein D3C71_2066710 [compost metagenome]
MPSAIAIRVTTCWLKGACDITPSDSTMISADRMKSVRTAPLILSFSKATRSTFSSAMAFRRSALCASSSSLECRNLCASFSTPS